MVIENLQLCLVFGSNMKQFVEFSLSCAVHLLKLRLQTEPSLKQILPLQGFANMTFRFAAYIILTRNLTHYILNIKSTPSTNPLQYFFKKNFM